MQQSRAKWADAVYFYDELVAKEGKLVSSGAKTIRRQFMKQIKQMQTDLVQEVQHRIKDGKIIQRIQQPTF